MTPWNKLGNDPSYDTATASAVADFNDSVDALDAERARIAQEAAALVPAVLNGTATAAATIKALGALRARLLQADIEELRLPGLIEAARALIRAHHAALLPGMKDAELKRRGELEKLADKLDYPKAGPLRHGFILSDPKRRELEAAAKACADLSTNGHHDHRRNEAEHVAELQRRVALSLRL